MISLEEARKLAKEGKASAPPKIKKPIPKKDPLISEIRKAAGIIAESLKQEPAADNTPLLLKYLKDAKSPINITIDRPKEWEFHITRDERQRISKVKAVAIGIEK